MLFATPRGLLTRLESMIRIFNPSESHAVRQMLVEFCFLLGSVGVTSALNDERRNVMADKKVSPLKRLGLARRMKGVPQTKQCRGAYPGGYTQGNARSKGEAPKDKCASFALIDGRFHLPHKHGIVFAYRQLQC
ncbi:MAG: hypothetical protein ACJATP_001692 [Candidatus Azotimanducaceae bacterium]|jgi:hypothetical protein